MPPSRRNPSSPSRPAPFWAARFLSLMVLVGAGLTGFRLGAAPGAESWLPTNTLAYVTVPSAQRFRDEWSRQALLSAWADPALKAFRDGFEREVERAVFAPLAELSGWHLGQLLGMAEGQVTYALAAPAPGGSNLVHLLLVDTGSRTNAAAALFQNALPGRIHPPTAPWPWLNTNLATGATIGIPAARLAAWFEATFPGEDSPSRPGTPHRGIIPLHVVRLGSRLIAGTETNQLPGILARLAGAPPALVSPAPASTDPSGFTNTLAHAWLHGPTCLRQFTRDLPPALAALAQSGVPVSRILDAFGLAGVQTASWTLRTTPQGWYNDLHVAVPAPARKGLLQLLEPASADAGPLPFLGDDVLAFRRLRFSGPRHWGVFERLLRDLDPAWLGVLQLFTGYAGRTEDADFDFEKQFLRLLGDDWMALTSRVPATNLLTAELFLHATPHASLVRTGLTRILAPSYLATFVPPDDPAPRRMVTNVAGHPLMSIEWPPIPWIGAGQYHFGQRGEWIAAGGSRMLLEGFLGAPAQAAVPLGQRPGVADAIRAVGGAAGGWFTYVHERETLRETFENLARHPEPSPSLLRWASLTEPTARGLAAICSWLDLRLLPPFPSVARHLHFRVTSGRATPDALHWTTFHPNPPPAPPSPPPAPAAR